MEEIKSQNLENNESKVSLESGIVLIKTGRVMNASIIENLLKDYIEISKTLPGKPSILADVTSASDTFGSIFRKNVASTIKDAFKNPGFKKIAIIGNRTTQQTIAMFIISLINLKNVRYFQKKEEAIEWLKEE